MTAFEHQNAVETQMKEARIEIRASFICVSKKEIQKT